MLRHVKAEGEFLDDMTLVAQLVAKLPASCQENWHLNRRDPSIEEDERDLGSKFVAWLERQGRAANSARLTQMSVALARHGGARGVEALVVRCPRCSKPGHKVGDCPKAEMSPAYREARTPWRR